MRGFTETERFVLSLAVTQATHSLEGAELAAADALVYRGLCTKVWYCAERFRLLPTSNAPLALRVDAFVRANT